MMNYHKVSIPRAADNIDPVTLRITKRNICHCDRSDIPLKQSCGKEIKKVEKIDTQSQVTTFSEKNISSDNDGQISGSIIYAGKHERV